MRNTQVRGLRQGSRRPGLNVVPSPDDGEATSETPVAAMHAAEMTAGIEVQEEELGAVIAQRVYKMRCGCGRSWFEIQLKKLVTCPACRKLGLVTSDGQPGATI